MHGGVTHGRIHAPRRREALHIENSYAWKGVMQGRSHTRRGITNAKRSHAITEVAFL